MLPAVVIRAPMQMAWESGEASACSELDSPSVTPERESQCTQVNAVGKQDNTTKRKPREALAEPRYGVRW